MNVPAYNRGRLVFLFVLFAVSSAHAGEQDDAANSRIHEIAQSVSQAFYKECFNEPLEGFSVISYYVDPDMNIPMIYVSANYGDTLRISENDKAVFAYSARDESKRPSVFEGQSITPPVSKERLFEFLQPFLTYFGQTAVFSDYKTIVWGSAGVSKNSEEYQLLPVEYQRNVVLSGVDYKPIHFSIKASPLTGRPTYIIFRPIIYPKSSKSVLDDPCDSVSIVKKWIRSHLTLWFICKVQDENCESYKKVISQHKTSLTRNQERYTYYDVAYCWEVPYTEKSTDMDGNKSMFQCYAYVSIESGEVISWVLDDIISGAVRGKSQDKRGFFSCSGRE